MITTRNIEGEKMLESDNVNFRKASKNDADGIFRVLTSAFQLVEGDFRWRNMRGLAYNATEDFLVLCKSDEIIGTVLISN